MAVERLKLQGTDWVRYFAAVGLCAYLAAICLALIVTSAFLANRREAVAVSASAVFGLLMSCALGAGVFALQRRELRYQSVGGAFGPDANFDRVLRLAEELGWRVTRQERGRRLEARTAGSMLEHGEWVVVQFREQKVLIASICDPGVGFSLVGRRRCQHNRELVRQVVVPQAS
jgi:hypothetical protein